MSKVRKVFRKFTLVNCWHMNDNESAAMWDLYLSSNEGIALQSTYDRLKNAFNKSEDEVYIGIVNYIDYDKEWMPEGNLFYPFLHKRKSFEHEKELRCIYQKVPMKKGIVDPDLEKEKRLRMCLGGVGNINLDDIDCESEPFIIGKDIAVDLNTLIENIYVSPTASDRFVDIVKSVVKKYGYNFNVIKSSLYSDPVF